MPSPGRTTLLTLPNELLVEIMRYVLGEIMSGPSSLHAMNAYMSGLPSERLRTVARSVFWEIRRRLRPGQSGLLPTMRRRR